MEWAEEGTFWWALMVLSPPETFSAILTLEGPPQQGIGGIALLTLSDTEDSLHFLLLFRGLLEARSGGKWNGGSTYEEGREITYVSEVSTCAAIAGPAQVPLRLQILHQGKLLRELQANASAQVSKGLALTATGSGLLLCPPYPALPPGAGLC